MVDDNTIDYTIISQAISHYKKCGYTYVELDWNIPSYFTEQTCPDRDRILYNHDRSTSLVGSAEQSFLYHLSTGDIDKNRRYVACTPCFRLFEPSDVWHKNQFMKVELFLAADQGHISMMYDAMAFMQSYNCKPYSVETHEGYDIEINGIEVGSYGYRDISSGIQYGTGIALPRFSMALTN